MKNLAREVLVAMTAVAIVGVLAVYGVRGWRLLALCAALLIVYFRPKRDAGARRERRIERQSDALARELEDLRDVLTRTMTKMYGEKVVPSQIRSLDLDR